MRRREFIALAGAAAAAALPDAAHGQQTGKVYRIGLLRVGPAPKAWVDGLRQGLLDLGYVEGRNIALEFNWATNAAQIPDLARRLARLNVDVIVASGTPSVLPARDAAGTIPVVFVAAIDPVATGLVASLARPGGNVTGVTAMQADITGKRLQLCRELIPGLSRIAVLVRATSQANDLYVPETKAAAGALGLQVQVLTLRDPGDLDASSAQHRVRLCSSWPMMPYSRHIESRLRTSQSSIICRRRMVLAIWWRPAVSWPMGRTTRTCIEAPRRRCTRS